MQKKEKIRSLFDSIAARYDRLNHLMSFNIDKRWRRKALREVIDPDRTQQILDLASGTGDFALAAARRMAPQSRITAIDLSEGMLQVMREKVAARNLTDRIAMELGDSEQMRFADHSFDVATIAFGIRNFEHREAGLREILRVLKPGGKLAILELSVPSFAPFRWLYKGYAFYFMPWIGGLISGDRAAYRYLPASVFAFPDKKTWMDTMRREGYVQVRHRSFSLGICRLYIGEKTA